MYIAHTITITTTKNTLRDLIHINLRLEEFWRGFSFVPFHPRSQ
jgi:hypothetical protein